MSTSPVPAVVAADERAQIRWILEHCRTIAVDINQPLGLACPSRSDLRLLAQPHPLLCSPTETHG